MCGGREMLRSRQSGVISAHSFAAVLLTVLASIAIFATVRANDSFITALTSENMNRIKDSAQVLFVAFCAEWCPYSRRLKPIFNDAANHWHTTNPGTRVVWGIIDSDTEGVLASSYGVEKYPTLKVFINGVLMPYEFRSSRTVEELNKFVAEQFNSNIREFSDPSALNTQMNVEKRNIIGYFNCADCVALKNFQKVSSFLRKDCDFWLSNGPNSHKFATSVPAVSFRDPEDSAEVKFSGNFEDYEYVKNWITDKCVPLVREVTFDNVEDLTEENIPFLLFFRDPADKASEKLFRDVVARELHDQRALINPLLADGEKFAHPLRHLGKTAADLPVLAIDSFQHMFLFEDMSQLPVPGKLRQFVTDLNSGDLHKKFHETLEQRLEELQQKAIKELEGIHWNNDNAKPPAVQPQLDKAKLTTPPESVFKELKPSKKRYTLLEKQEL